VNRRTQIQLSQQERKAYVKSAKTVILCTNGTGGYPHAVAMWFIANTDETIWMTTYRKSQKALNISRDGRVALLVESGVTYDTLRGVLMRGNAELIEDPEVVLDLLKRVHEKMTGSFPEGVDDVLRAQAGKRVAIRVAPERISSWDHARLAGRY